ncbi:hypothetical protein OG895_37000 [Streptomyces sp. NBC_00201]|uniref:hypothetical protein n=1 Tax=unclassified Streptomyces TaxID=2593676 RepID=UPI0022578AF7|nr:MULTISPECIES: hypothetical protein [unclassified Streptomyces]MCX5250734.1 hypothetical protein [Streptomyces sp. NBC_00201]MCX5291337.1 hypothetical protein [Streptomyces sp. NBC_00183]
MSQQHTIRRAMHRFVQRYLRATAANASHGYIPLATGPFGALDESRRLGAPQESGFRHA